MPLRSVSKTALTTSSQLGLCVYSAMMGIMFYHRAGVHQWDLTVPQARTVLFVGAHPGSTPLQLLADTGLFSQWFWM
jgi:hypothetical protein